LPALAARQGISKFKLHRAFQAATGVTLARYVEQTRLHRAALALILTDARIIDVALASGYEHHETFLRAFRRIFRCTPREFRRSHEPLGGPGHPQRISSGDAYTLSATRPAALRALDIAFVRHTGAYEDVPDAVWHTLTRRLAERGLGWGALLGIGRDDPAHAPRGQCRFDAAATLTGPPPARSRDGSLRYDRLAPMTCAVTSHVGSYRSLTDAMPEIFARSAQLDGFRIVGLPVIEVYHQPIVGAEELSHTDVYVPLTSAAQKLGFVENGVS
jgi:AraC-like DNA-binding protein/DNA gyrase inhibitor GyrI